MKLAEENIKLAYHFANKWQKRSGVEFDECISICFEGLCLAAKNYKEEKGIKFSTFLGFCIDNLFYRRIRDKGYLKRKGETISLSAMLTANDGEKLTLADTLGELDDYSLLIEGIKDLKGRERTIVSLRLKGYTQGEIADYIGVSQPHIGRILNKLRKEILC